MNADLKDLIRMIVMLFVIVTVSLLLFSCSEDSPQEPVAPPIYEEFYTETSDLPLNYFNGQTLNRSEIEKVGVDTNTWIYIIRATWDFNFYENVKCKTRVTKDASGTTYMNGPWSKFYTVTKISMIKKYGSLQGEIMKSPDWQSVGYPRIEILLKETSTNNIVKYYIGSDNEIKLR
jgi:hypothetical protein